MNKWLIFGCFLTLLSGCTSHHLEIFPDLADPNLVHTKLSVMQMHEDIDALIAGANARHPALDQYADTDQLQQAVAQLKASITTAMIRTDFYRHIGRLTHLFNDGHSLLIWPYQEYQALTDAGEKPFPFDVTISHNSKMLLKHPYSNGDVTLPAGAEIVAINGLSSSELLAHLSQYAGGETTYLRTQFVAGRLGLMLWATLGYLNDFELTLSYNKQHSHYNINKHQQWHTLTKQPASDAEHYYRKLNFNTGLLFLKHFDISPDDFEDFVDDTFVQIKTDGIENLIIDIRENPGGNTDTVTYLARYLADKPFRLVSAMQEKLNQDNRGWFNQKGQPGDILTQQWDDWEHPMKMNKRFKGDVYLLTGAISYSAAIVFATTLKDNGFATLVGETTGGFANQTAQGNLFNLPHSALRAYIATRLLVRPNGDTTRTGVVPHIEVIATAEDIAQQIDPALNRVLALINNKASAN